MQVVNLHLIHIITYYISEMDEPQQSVTLQLNDY